VCKRIFVQENLCAVTLQGFWHTVPVRLGGSSPNLHHATAAGTQAAHGGAANTRGPGSSRPPRTAVPSKKGSWLTAMSADARQLQEGKKRMGARPTAEDLDRFHCQECSQLFQPHVSGTKASFVRVLCIAY